MTSTTAPGFTVLKTHETRLLPLVHVPAEVCTPCTETGLENVTVSAEFPAALGPEFVTDELKVIKLPIAATALLAETVTFKSVFGVAFTTVTAIVPAAVRIPAGENEVPVTVTV